MISLQQWRAVIGTYSHRVKGVKWRPQTLTPSGESISLALRIVLFLLLTVQGHTEVNPGPTFTAAKDDLLQTLDKKVRDLEKKLNETEEALCKMREVNSVMKEVCLEQAQKLDQLESHTRRDNIVIHNVPGSNGPQESWSDTEEKVRNYLEKIGVDRDVKIDRAHRLKTRSKPEPIIVKMNFYKDKQKILEKAKEAKRNKPGERQRSDEARKEEIWVTEDYTTRVRRTRQMLRPKLEEAIAANKKVFYSYDKLVVDGVPFWYDDTKKSVVSTKPKTLSCLDCTTSFNTIE